MMLVSTCTREHQTSVHVENSNIGTGMVYAACSFSSSAACEYSAHLEC